MINRWKEALDLTSIKYRTPLLGLIEHLPECAPVLFDRCITHSDDDEKHEGSHVINYLSSMSHIHSLFITLVHL